MNAPGPLAAAAAAALAVAAAPAAIDRAELAKIETPRVVRAAAAYLAQPPVTITASPAVRSTGGPHDFFSEGDYWWPDPANPGGPYIRRDGESNPENFVAHRRALVRLSVEAPALTSAWIITRDRRYADHAAAHLRAWFVDPATRMNPSLQYAQAIHGRSTGRGTGIIDTVHLVEVVQALIVLHESGAIPDADFGAAQGWFRDYVRWLTTHPNGIEERDAKNNHATCWVVQVAEFAKLTGDTAVMNDCRRRFKTVLLPTQMAADGSFPLELSRTKPYGYSLFNLDAMAAICQILSTPHDDLWTFDLPDGRGMRRALRFMAPYIGDKRSWPRPPDVEYDREWPMRHSSLLFGGIALGRLDYIRLWRTLPADSTVDEVIRNFFIRQPLLWIR